jgi:hypothetical protein
VMKSCSEVVALPKPTYPWPSANMLLVSATVTDGRESPWTLWTVRANVLRIGS